MIILDLASMMYIQKPKKQNGEPIPFEKLENKDILKWQKAAANIIVMLDKVNYVVVPKKFIQAITDNKDKTFARVLEVVTNFINALRHPKNLKLYFNNDVCKELTSQISRAVYEEKG